MPPSTLSVSLGLFTVALCHYLGVARLMLALSSTEPSCRASYTWMYPAFDWTVVFAGASTWYVKRERITLSIPRTCALILPPPGFCYASPTSGRYRCVRKLGVPALCVRLGWVSTRAFFVCLNFIHPRACLGSLDILAGLDIFRRGWVLCARVGHEECTLCPGLCTLNSFGVLDATMYNLLVTRLVVSLVRYRHLAYQ